MMKILVYLDVTFCRLYVVCHHFEGPSVPRSADDLRTKYGDRSVLQKPVTIYPLIRTHIQEYIKLKIYRV